MFNAKTYLIILAVILVAMPDLPLPATNESAVGTLIDSYIMSFPEYESFSGFILVADGDRILFQKGYGFANRECGLPNTIATGFQIGSVSKAFTAMIALKLAQEGLLDLDKKITDYLPFFPVETGSRITIRQLLSNTSGIPHHFQAVPDYFRSHDHYYHFPRELLRLFWSTPLRHEPGARFTYSSPGYYIIGAILQQVAKKSLNELLQELICAPLGMKNTFIENNLYAGRDLAAGYMRGISGLVKAYREDKSTALGAGDIVSSAYDLYLWQRSLHLGEGKLLDARSREILFTPVVEGSPLTMSGPHFKVPYENGTRKLAVSVLNGSSSGYSSCLNRQTELDRCVIVLSNINGEDVTRIADDIGDIVLRHHYRIAIGEEAPLTRTLPQGCRFEEREWQNVAGFYRTAPGSYAGIILSGGRGYCLLFRRDSGTGSLLELTPRSESEFFAGHNRSFTCRLDTRENGSFGSLEISRKGRVFEKGRRVGAEKVELQEYSGFYSSRELQTTVRIGSSENNLLAEGAIFGHENRLLFLEKELFGSTASGFIRFRRDSQGAIAGFELFNEKCDRFFGSLFERIAD